MPLQGHPLNPQDNNGWTPLHEASNHGHLDVAAALLESGADINNRGGPGCNGMTPLMDAASNGHIEMMTLLIQHRANVIAKDDRVNKLGDICWFCRIIIFGS